MKKFIFAMVMVLTCSVVLTSCRNGKGELAEEIKKANKQCPVNIGVAGEISSFDYDESANEVTMKISLAESMPLKIDVMNKMKSAMKKNMLGTLSASENSKKMCKKIADAGAAFVVVLKNKSGESVNITIEEQEVKDVAEGKVVAISSKEYIDFSVELSNAQCPIMVDEMTSLESVQLVDNNVVYEYIIDEEQVSMEDLEAGEPQMRAQLLNTMKSNDPTLTALVKHCKNNNTGIIYQYTGNITGLTFEIHFSSSEL